MSVSSIPTSSLLLFSGMTLREDLERTSHRSTYACRPSTCLGLDKFDLSYMYFLYSSRLFDQTEAKCFHRHWLPATVLGNAQKA